MHTFKDSKQLTRMNIQCKNISFSYPKKQQIFNDITFEFNGSGFHALFGESGVGKSTLAQIISGLQIPDTGKIVNQSGSSQIIYTTNQERFPGWQTIQMHFDSILPAHKKEDWQHMMSLFGIEQCFKSKFSQLSLGQKNRVNLIRYLLQSHPVLIMDESLANVDESMRETIILFIKEQFPEKLFIYISHHVREICKYCNQIVVLRSVIHSPQTIHFKGQNLRNNHSIDPDKLKENMLEIVHAT
jgi:ABC-type multidrug transport system ATPase subunit